MLCLALLSLYMAFLSGACASGFAYFDRLKIQLRDDYNSMPTNSIWTDIRSTYGSPTDYLSTLVDVMHENKQRIGIISAVFLLAQLLKVIAIIFHMRRDVLYFK